MLLIEIEHYTCNIISGLKVLALIILMPDLAVPYAAPIPVLLV
jgi:hypothetical protein